MPHQNFRVSRLRGWLLASAIAVASGATVLALQLDLLKPQIAEDPTSSEVNLTEKLGASTFLSRVGFSGLAASWLWIDFIQYYGDSGARRVTGFRQSADYLEGIAAVEPRFRNIYFVANSAVANRAGQPERAVALLDTGMMAISPDFDREAFRLPFHKAVISFLFLNEIEAGREAYYTAADWFEQANDSSADGLRQLADRLAENPDSRFVQFSVWAQTYNVSQDEETREIALSRLAELGTVNRLPDGTVELIPPREAPPRPVAPSP